MATPAARGIRTRYVVALGANGGSVAQLGELGHGLMRISRLGIPVPPGFVVSADAHRSWRETGTIGPEVWEEIVTALDDLRREATARPATVTVRPSPPPGARGILPSFPDVGLTRDAVVALAAAGDDQPWRRYERLLRRWATGVHRLPAERVAAAAPEDGDPEANAAALEALLAAEGAALPERLVDQVRAAVRAVWEAWRSPAAERHRRLAGIPDELGAAVVVQAMVVTGEDERSGAGTVITRNPRTGSPKPAGSFIPGARGHSPIGNDPAAAPARLAPALDDVEQALSLIEAEFRDVCEVRYLIAGQRPWFVGVRPAERSSTAAVRVAVDMVDEGLVDVDEALARVPVSALLRLQSPVIARGQRLEPLAHGVSWVPGLATGHAAFDPGDALARHAAGEPVVLVRESLGTDDIPAVAVAAGVVTCAPDAGLVAATLAISAGRPAIREARPLSVAPDGTQARFGDAVLPPGAPVTVDGGTGTLWAGHARVVPPQPDAHLARLLDWCDERAHLEIVPAVPGGWSLASSVDEAASGARRVVIDIDALGPRAGALEEAATAAVEAGAEELGVRLGEMPRGGDVQLPAGPWRLIVAPAGAEWAARLLAARGG